MDGSNGAEVDSLSSYFDRQASVWRAMYADHPGVYASIQRQRREWVLGVIRELQLPTGTLALEVGIGSGNLAVALARDHLKIMGVDLSSSMLELTRQAARREGVAGRISVLLADGSRLPFQDNEFQVVIAIGVIPWVANARQLLAELCRVVAPSGHLVITADNDRRLPYLFDPRFNPWLSKPRRAAGALVRRGAPRRAVIRGISRSQFHLMLTESGLEIRRTYPLGFGPFTFLGQPLLTERLGHLLNAQLQRSACRGGSALPETACQHLVLARSRA